MAIVWQQLNAPEIAITEAAVGAGITTMLFVAAISKTTRWEE
jgi:energy-converting hydrogenase B subunit D